MSNLEINSIQLVNSLTDEKIIEINKPVTINQNDELIKKAQSAIYKQSFKGTGTMSFVTNNKNNECERILSYPNKKFEVVAEIPVKKQIRRHKKKRINKKYIKKYGYIITNKKIDFEVQGISKITEGLYQYDCEMPRRSVSVIIENNLTD